MTARSFHGHGYVFQLKLLTKTLFHIPWYFFPVRMVENIQPCLYRKSSTQTLGYLNDFHINQRPFKGAWVDRDIVRLEEHHAVSIN